MQIIQLYPATYSLMFAVLFVTVSCCVAVVADASPTKWVLGTATQGGGFQLFGQNLAEVINAEDSSLQVEVIATKKKNEL